MPTITANADAMKAKGVDTVAVTAVNDVFVMQAWKRDSDLKNQVEFLADGSADFAKAIGLDADMSAGGMGVRSKRYSMLIEDGVVKKLNVEEKPGVVELSGGDNLLKQL
jgi:peroxiredoxin